MIIQPINSIECALLHNRFSPIPGGKLFEGISTRAKMLGCNGQNEIVGSPDPSKEIFDVGEYRITILQRKSTLPSSGFGGCLPQPITGMMMPDAEQRVAQHIAHSFVSISRNLFAEGSRNVTVDGSNLGEFGTSDEARRAMTLAYHISDMLHRNNPASAFHWLPSDHLVPPHIFEAASSGHSLTRFFIRPYLYSSAGVIGDEKPVGLVANGSQYMLPKPVIFEEAKVSHEWMIKRSIQFIDKAVKNPEVLQDGSAFGVDEGEVIEVSDRDSEPANPMGSYTLTVRNAPKFDIRGGLQTVLFNEHADADAGENTDHELDETDPIDLAILAALRERANEMKEPTTLPPVKDRRMQPRETHEAARFGKRAVFGKR